MYGVFGVKEMGSGLEACCACSYDSDIAEIRVVSYCWKERQCMVRASDFDQMRQPDEGTC